MRSAADNAQRVEFASEERLQLLERVPARKGKTLQDAPDRGADAFRRGLAGLATVLSNGGVHVVRCQEPSLAPRKCDFTQATSIIFGS